MRAKGLKLVIILSALSLILLMLFYLALDKGYIRFNYPSRDKYPVHGLDISHHQKDIDWDKLDKNYTHFIFMKVTEGANHQDSRYKEYWEETQKRNIPVGFYHFFTFCRDGKSQAENFIEHAPNVLGNLAPVIDLEYGGNCVEENRVDDIVGEIEIYLAMVEEAFGAKVIIYTTPQFHKDYLLDKFTDNPIWYRSIYTEPRLPENKDWQFWQYANKGHLDGIEGFVDINVFNGSVDDLKQILKK